MSPHPIMPMEVADTDQAGDFTGARSPMGSWETGDSRSVTVGVRVSPDSEATHKARDPPSGSFTAHSPCRLDCGTCEQLVDHLRRQRAVDGHCRRSRDPSTIAE